MRVNIREQLALLVLLTSLLALAVVSIASVRSPSLPLSSYYADLIQLGFDGHVLMIEMWTVVQ